MHVSKRKAELEGQQDVSREGQQQASQIRFKAGRLQVFKYMYVHLTNSFARML